MLKIKNDKAKKLTLTRETVRQLALTAEQLRQASGGRPPNGASDPCQTAPTAPC